MGSMQAKISKGRALIQTHQVTYSARQSIHGPRVSGIIINSHLHQHPSPTTSTHNLVDYGLQVTIALQIQRPSVNRIPSCPA